MKAATRLANCVLFLFLLSACFGSFFFIKGFLKVKDYLPTRADTRFSPLIALFPNDSVIEEYVRLRQHRPAQYQQVFWLIIDMLPIYVVRPNPDTSTIIKPLTTTVELNYENIMEHTKQMLKDSPEASATYSFLSDEPTMTNSRVEAMGTGSHTSYVKIATGFQNGIAEEDNFIAQLYLNNLSSVHIGDSLWTQLYPQEHYVRSFSDSAYSELSLTDLIRRHMPAELNRTDWQFMVVHGNELDHSVHMYGWASPMAVESIKESDEEIYNVTRTFQPNSMFLVFGDHGATRDGHHGGGSKEELESGMFAYTSRNFTFRALLYPERAKPKVRELLNILGETMNKTFLSRDEFPQIDIVPTMSAIYNIPIPYSNLGVILPEMMHYEGCVVTDCLYELMMEHVLNFAQIVRFLQVFVHRHPDMSGQLEKLLRVKDEIIKARLADLVARAEAQTREEQRFVRGELQEISNKEGYKKLVQDMFDVMVRIRTELQHNSLVFKKEWNSREWHLIYSNLVIRVFATLMIAGSILLIYTMLKQGSKILTASLVTNPFVAILFLVLFIAVLTTPSMLSLGLIFVLCISVIGTIKILQLIWSNLTTIKEAIKTEPWKVSTVLAGFVLVVQLGAYGFNATSPQYLLPYITNAAAGSMLFVAAVKRPESCWALLCVAVCAVLVRVVDVFWLLKEFFESSYVISSAAPSALFFAGCLYSAVWRVDAGINKWTRGLLISCFVVCFTGMVKYQTGELDKTYKSNYFTYIILPRSVFAAAGLQILFLVASLFCRRLLWTREPPKQARLYALFLFFLMSILPSLLLMAGPYQQIYYLTLCVLAHFLHYAMEKVSEENSLLHYTLYPLLMDVMYQMTGHPLDFMGLRVQRAFVGFPEFSTATNFSLVFFETVGVYSLMMVMVPMFKSRGKTEAEDPSNVVIRAVYKKCDQNDPESVELPSRQDEYEAPPNSGQLTVPQPSGEGEGEVQEDTKLELTLVKNYFAILLGFEMLHNGMTAYLIVNFTELFFNVSPIEFTFRFIDWYIYILTCLYVYIIGLAQTQLIFSFRSLLFHKQENGD